MHSDGSQPGNPPVPRFRSASAVYPAGYNFQSQYPRPMPPLSPNNYPRATTYPTPYNSTGYQSAPLMPPAEFQTPRTPGDPARGDYNMGQLSAPIAAPQDFTAAYNQALSPRSGMAEHQPEGAQGMPGMHQPQQPQEQHHQPQTVQNDEYNARETYGDENTEARRKSYSMPGTYETS